jgi:hypothetical protein
MEFKSHGGMKKQLRRYASVYRIVSYDLLAYDFEKTIPVHGTTAHDLEGIMSEALDKAEELHSWGIV